LTTTKVGSFVVPERGRFMLPAVPTGPSNEKTAAVRTALQTAVVVLSPKYCGPGTDSLAHCDDQLVVPHTWVVDGEPGAAVGSGVGRVAPENVAGCGEQTTVFVGYAWASTRAPVHKPARKSRSPPRASMHVEALVMTALQVDLADWTGKR
jgi:hypothetical protein